MISIPRNKALFNDTLNTRPFTISHLRCQIMPFGVSQLTWIDFFCIYTCRRHRALYFFYLAIPLYYFAFPDKVFNNVWQHGMYAEIHFYMFVWCGANARLENVRGRGSKYYAAEWKYFIKKVGRIICSHLGLSYNLWPQLMPTHRGYILLTIDTYSFPNNSLTY